MNRFMTFGEAIETLKEGEKVARSGWNGKNMYIYLNKGSLPEVNYGDDTLVDGIRPDLFELGDRDTSTRLPNINMRSVSGAIVTGWLASQTDMLAEDWVVVD